MSTMDYTLTAMHQLKCAVQTYAWGKVGNDSTVAKLAFHGGHIDSVDCTQSYAELWMGTHPNGPSLILSSKQTLLKHISTSKGIFHVDDLKYLLKVLSVKKPLSIQIHPDKAWAKVLHANHPDVYKDPNHKPEMAIALTPFRALCGFLPADKISEHLTLLSTINPKLKHYLGLNVVKIPDDLKSVFLKLMAIDEEGLKELIDSFATSEKTPLKALFHEINGHFPYDRGVLCIYFLNYFELSAGEAIFLEPLTPHAYLSGDCIECMALSDNVVRAGLTPKLIDIETLQKITNYKFSTESDFRVHPRVHSEFNKLYLPPGLDDFAVQCMTLTPTHNEVIARDGKTRILLVVSGQLEISHLESSMFCETGAAVLLLPDRDYVITSGFDNSLVYIAF